MSPGRIWGEIKRKTEHASKGIASRLSHNFRGHSGSRSGRRSLHDDSASDGRGPRGEEDGSLTMSPDAYASPNRRSVSISMASEGLPPVVRHSFSGPIPLKDDEEVRHVAEPTIAERETLGGQGWSYNESTEKISERVANDMAETGGGGEGRREEGAAAGEGEGEGDGRGAEGGVGGEARGGWEGWGMSEERVGWCEEALTQLKQRIRELDAVSKVTGQRGYVEAFETLRAQANKASGESKQHSTSAMLPANRPKNRYVDVLPYESCRVILGGQGETQPDASDYINASHIVMDASDPHMPRYIAAQGPLDETAGAFWHMVWEQRVAAVIMLTREVEGSRLKCSHYFPSAPGGYEAYGHMRVRNEATEEMSDGGTIKRQLTVENDMSPGSPLSLLHLHYLDWPDHGVPRDTESIRDLMRFLRDSPVSSGPFVIHCSAGIGRTGAYCVVDHAVRKVLQGDLSSLDMASTVLLLRAQRAGMVQTKEQYRFCYTAVRDELKHLIKTFNSGPDSDSS
ncbi:hypothetical protein CLOM_g21815 [Closterium sp. NIES-68]|nr:hypothetical protein CLOM_g21815 [Closterium sp. NIES-68]GJP84293.1 hypothetical protein CLOP_g14356 [Closterium sp. NIES-67]